MSQSGIVMIAVVIVLIVLYFVVTIILKKNITKKIESAIMNGEMDEYRRLVFSKVSAVVLDQEYLALLRASILASEEKFEDCANYLKLINPTKMKLEDALTYYQLQFQVAVGNKDKELSKKVQSELQELKKKNRSEFLDNMIQENSINQRLYIEYDSSVIEDLIHKANKVKGTDKGQVYMSLAKAYYLNNEESKANETLNKAKELLKDTVYEPIIEATLKEQSLMD